MTNQEKVKEFLIKHGKELPTRPQLPSKEIEKLALDLIWEEYKELVDALEYNNLKEVIDACADIEVVVHNLTLYCGIKSQEVFDEVHRSNMTKNGGLRGDGKILKGEAYEPPEIDRIIERQTNE